MCNNNGACRKLTGGVMCPSYRVTRDERDVTRGRANTLRLAITGQLGSAALISDEMAETLKLCVSCKACRRECPTGVDMARMKIEVQAARAAKFELSLHDKLVGFLPHYAPYAAHWHHFFNLRDRSAILRKASQLVAGFSSRRSLPKWRKDTYRDRSDWRYTTAEQNAAAREVVLFADTFNRYFERENLDDALSVLVAGGYRVHAPLPPNPMSGRYAAAALFSRSAWSTRHGAKCNARWMRLRLMSHAGCRSSASNRAACSPSATNCRLCSRVRSSDALAANALLFEEFIAREHKQGDLNLPLGAAAEKGAAARPLPSEGLRHDGRSREHAQADPEAFGRDDRIELLRHGRLVRLRRRDHRRLAQDGRTVAAACRAQGGQPTH